MKRGDLRCRVCGSLAALEDNSGSLIHAPESRASVELQYGREAAARSTTVLCEGEASLCLFH